MSIAGIILILVILLYVILFSKNNFNIFNNNTSKMSGLSWSIDKSSWNEICTQAFEVIYEDNNYKYTVPNGCIANYKVVYSNGKSYTLKDALSKGKVTIQDLINKRININKDKK